MRRDDTHALHLHALLLPTACDDRIAGQSAHRHKERPLKDLEDGTCSFHTCSVSSFFKARNVLSRAMGMARVIIRLPNVQIRHPNLNIRYPVLALKKSGHVVCLGIFILLEGGILRILTFY